MVPKGSVQGIEKRLITCAMIESTRQALIICQVRTLWGQCLPVRFPSYLQELLDSSQVVLIEDIGLLQESAILLVNLTQEVMKHQRGMGLFAGCICPRKRECLP